MSIGKRPHGPIYERQFILDMLDILKNLEFSYVIDSFFLVSNPVWPTRPEFLCNRPTPASSDHPFELIQKYKKRRNPMFRRQPFIESAVGLTCSPDPAPLSCCEEIDPFNPFNLLHLASFPHPKKTETLSVFGLVIGKISLRCRIQCADWE